MLRGYLASPILMLLTTLAVNAQAALPIVEDIEWGPFRDHCRQLLRVLDKTTSPIPAKTVRELAALLDRKPNDPAAASAAVQNLLDPHCLIAVNINAESR